MHFPGWLFENSESASFVPLCHALYANINRKYRVGGKVPRELHFSTSLRPKAKNTLFMYTVRMETKCSEDNEILHGIIRDTTQLVLAFPIFM